MNVYLIEDEPARLDLLGPLLKTLNRLSGSIDGDGWQNGFTGNSKEECLSSEGIKRALDDSNAVILLDVDLGLPVTEQDTRIQFIETQFKDDSQKADEFKTAHLDDLLLNSRHRLAVSIFAFALAKDRRVVVTSGVGLAIKSSEKLGVPTGLFPEKGARRVDEQLETLAEIIIDAASGYHQDKWVNEFVKQWINGYRALGSEGKSFCQHPHLENQQEFARYEALIGAMCSLGTPVLNNAQNGRKALLQLNAVPGDSVESVEWFVPWLPNQAIPQSKPISIVSMETLFKAATGHLIVMDIQNQCGETIKQAHLPVFPALPFIAGLRILFQALRDQDGGILHSAAMRLTGRGGLYQLSIPLTPNIDKTFGMSRRWIEKCESGGAPITTNGVCAALWNLSQAKIQNINETVARDEVERALLGVFDGPDRTVAAVGFGPHQIELYWRASE
jgi:hypothetical protein